MFLVAIAFWLGMLSGIAVCAILVHYHNRGKRNSIK